MPSFTGDSSHADSYEYRRRASRHHNHTLLNSVDSLSDLYEQLDLTKEQRKSQKIREVTLFVRQLESYAESFDYRQLHEFLTDSTQKSLELTMLAPRTVLYAQEIVLSCFEARLWLAKVRKDALPYTSIFLNSAIALLHIIFVISNFIVGVSIVGFLVNTMTLSFLVLQKREILFDSWKKFEGIEINIKERRQIKLFEVRGLFMHLLIMKLDPNIKIIANQNGEIEVKLYLAKNTASLCTSFRAI